MTLATAAASATAVYPLNEASGSAIASVGGLDLAENGTGGVGTGTGKVHTTARDFERDDSDYFSHASATAFQTGDIQFMLRAWVKLESKPSGGQQAIVGKWTNGTWEYLLDYIETVDRFRFVICDASDNFTVIAADTFGIPSTATWYLIHGWHDSVANQIGIAVNAGTADTASATTGVRSSSGVFMVGAKADGPGAFFDGLIDDVVLLKTYILDATERTADYNAGTGVAFANWTAGATNRRRRVLICGGG